ncbi:hypothetical protein ACR6C2_42140 [Streptomyces sp. INA 01156]
MGRKSPYPEEFGQDAVALHRAAGGKRTYPAVAADLGITAELLRTWLRKDDLRACATPPRRPALPGPSRPRRRHRPVRRR